MDARPTPNDLLFETFRLGRNGGPLCRRRQDGVFETLAVGSRPLELLHYLVDRRGDLVTKGELMAAVWPQTVVEENNLAVHVSALRRLLDQGRSDGSCIQTVPGRGYRFVAEVTPFELLPLLAPSPDSSSQGSGANREDRRPDQAPAWYRRRRAVLGAMAVAVLLVGTMTAANWHPLWRGAETPAHSLSIVVLPFANLSDDREQQYFADGITEDLTTDLSRIADSFVISRNTAFTYRDKPAQAKEIGRELGVRYVLEGSVRRSGNQVRVNAQLIDAEIDAHLWAERFEHDIADLFTTQNDITSRIAVALNYALVGAEAARPRSNPDAWDYVLRGRASALKPASYDEGVVLFDRALSLDPSSVEARSRLAIALTRRVLGGVSTTRAADIARAQDLVKQVLVISPRSVLAHLAYGNVLRAQDRCQEAIVEYELVVAANRNSPSALASLAQCKFYTGAVAESVPLVEQAIRLSPRDPDLGFWYLQLGRAHLVQSRTDEAIRWLEKARSANPAHPPTRGFLAAAYALNGDTVRGGIELAEARRLCGDDRYSSIARLLAVRFSGAPKIRALYESTFFAGLRRAGMPEE